MKRHILSLSTCLVFSTSAMASTSNVNNSNNAPSNKETSQVLNALNKQPSNTGKMNAVYKPSSLANSSNLLHKVSSHTSKPDLQKDTNVLQHLTAVASNSVSNFKQSGLASWYDKKPHNEKTASGEVFNKNAMTGAHQTLSLGSFVKVTNKANGKSVVIKINDRPDSNHNSGKSILDLSYGAAKKIGMDNQKLSKVVIERVSTPTNFVTYKSI